VLNGDKLKIEKKKDKKYNLLEHIFIHRNMIFTFLMLRFLKWFFELELIARTECKLVEIEKKKIKIKQNIMYIHNVYSM
jgi:hypothetical protein